MKVSTLMTGKTPSAEFAGVATADDFVLAIDIASTASTKTGDFIVVVNAEKLRVTGNKANDKVYYRHSGFPGGIYGTKFKDMQAKHPGRALEKAVKGMLPKGPLGYAMVKKLKVYAGGSHPHAAQQPKALEI